MCKMHNDVFWCRVIQKYAWCCMIGIYRHDSMIFHVATKATRAYLGVECPGHITGHLLRILLRISDSLGCAKAALNLARSFGFVQSWRYRTTGLAWLGIWVLVLWQKKCCVSSVSSDFRFLRLVGFLGLLWIAFGFHGRSSTRPMIQLYLECDLLRRWVWLEQVFQKDMFPVSLAILKLVWSCSILTYSDTFHLLAFIYLSCSVMFCHILSYSVSFKVQMAVVQIQRRWSTAC